MSASIATGIIWARDGALLEIEDNGDSLVGKAIDIGGVGEVVRGGLPCFARYIFSDLCNDIGKTYLVAYLGSEIEPRTIEITAEAYTHIAIVGLGEDFAIASVCKGVEIETKSATHCDIRAIVAFTLGRPLEVERDGDGYGEVLGWFDAFPVVLSRDIVDGGIAEMQSRSEAKIEVSRETQVGNEAHIEPNANVGTTGIVFGRCYGVHQVTRHIHTEKEAEME